MKFRIGGHINALPNHILIGGTFISIAAIAGTAYFFLRSNPLAAFIILGGVVLVGLLILGYVLILKWMRQRKANPLTQGLAGNAAAAPQGISEPARRARLDDLRRNFEQGVEKFRAAGKNLYSVPWYVLVGEPGSGKTEAIRHCNVGFPPGLQDQLQGAGGTLNMNWWFTNQAIILDTAGRLMFEEVAPGSTNEWNEFLKLLKNNRPNSPLNGMLLVIPVDTLIKDSADNIEKKAGKIAQQFDQIQRILGVRFPVFVIITKCDLLNGFREFFDDLNDPQLQHQIMGWSNPAPLDERFDPATVMNHIETVKARLTARRQHLLLDPVNTEDPQGRRVDQVDALYALPDSMSKIAPRLRRYLEMIFVTGEWSPKPLFLRGIYFTSSMTEGSALDAELAEVLGVPVDSLPEGRVWRRDRAYFLRDLFIEKVFREKGLVTRASNADKQQRARRSILLTCSILAVLILMVFTYLGYRQLESSIGSRRDFWEGAAKYDPAEMLILGKNNAYFDDKIVPFGGTKSSVGEFFGSNLKLVKEPLKTPLVFKPMDWLSGSINSKQAAAYRALYERTILVPAYSAARKKIVTPSDAWSPAASEALAQLMKLEYAASLGKLPPEPVNPQTDLSALFTFVLSPDDLAKFKAEAEPLQAAANWIYTDEASGTKAWPAPILGPGSPAALLAVDEGVKQTIAYWQRQTSDKSVVLEKVNTVRAALRDYRDAETALIALKSQPIDKIDTYNAFRDKWLEIINTRLKDASDRATKAWNIATNNKPDDASLLKLYDEGINKIRSDAENAYNALLQYTPESAPNVDASKAGGLPLARLRLSAALDDLRKWSGGDAARAARADVEALDRMYLGVIKAPDDSRRPRFEVHSALYDIATGRLVKKDTLAPAKGSLEETFAGVEKDYSAAIDLVKRPSIAATGPDDRLNAAVATASFALDTSRRARKFLLADAALSAMPSDPAKWPDYIGLQAKNWPADSLQRPAIPLVSFPEKTFSPRFCPEAAGAAADALATIRRTTSAPDANVALLEVASLSASAGNVLKGFDGPNGYRDAYVRYWRDTAKEDLRIGYAKFSEMGDALVNVTEAAVSSALKQYGERMSAALARIGASQEASAIASAPVLVKDECKQALNSWANLGSDAKVARRAILALDGGTFRDNYTVPSSKTNDSYAARYWQELPLAGLRVLAKEGQDEILAGLTELAKYERFPLAPPGDRKDDLSLADVLAARAALERVRGAGAAVAATPAAGAAPGLPGQRPIGQGGNTRDRDIDRILDDLRGTNLLRDKQEYFDKLERFLLALPSDSKPVTLTFAVNKEKLKEDNAISFRYAYMVISQNAKDLREAALSASIADTATVELPGGDLTLGFRDVPNGKILQTETFNGPWGALRALKNPGVKSVTREGNKWIVEYTVTSDKKAYALWYNLEFKSPLPDLKDWPVPPGRR